MIKNYMRYVKEQIMNLIIFIDNIILNKFRFKTQVLFLKSELGWFSGEEFCFLKIKIIDDLNYDMVTIFSIQIFKFSFSIWIDFN